MKRPKRAAVLLMAVVWLLYACAPFPREPTTPVATYLLETASAPLLAPTPGCHSLLINNVRSAPGYGTSRIIYMREPHRLEYFAFHEWADSPASMLQPVLVRAAEQSGLFAMVVTPESSVQGDLRVDTQLLSLEQHVNGGESRVELNVRVRLFGRESLIGSRLFHVEEPTSPNPVAGVNAANAAVEKFTGSLFEWIAAVIGEADPPCPS